MITNICNNNKRTRNNINESQNLSVERNGEIFYICVNTMKRNTEKSCMSNIQNSDCRVFEKLKNIIYLQSYLMLRKNNCRDIELLVDKIYDRIFRIISFVGA